ncbi:MAG: antitoxin VapB family protein [Kiritimatiellae bacterium]|nr:antitoxin VapB family protein [Kiritimatiellia bacterium]
MKTISLTDEAYRRLKEWKSAAGESFSHVVLRLVPQKGTLAQMVDDVGRLPPLTRKEWKVMEETVRWGRDPERNREPWTT